MAVHKRRKKSRMRGTHTHGWGEKKHHRNAGSRGGHGKAGSGKRSDNKKPSFWKDTKYFGRYGFIMHGPKDKINAINVQWLDENADKLVKEGLASKEGNMIVIDLDKLGYNKILSNGKITKKLKIISKYASAGAAEKLKESGCELVVAKAEAE